MDTLVSLGYWGLFIGSFLASTIIRMSADVLLVGVLALGGNVWGCLAIATVGNWLGGLTSYWIGWLGRWDWIERWFKVKREKLEQQKGHVDRYGVWLALFTWWPIVGDLFAIALGFYRVRPKMSAFYMLVSSGSVDPVTVTSYHWNHRHRMNHRRIHQMTRHRC